MRVRVAKLTGTAETLTATGGAAGGRDSAIVLPALSREPMADAAPVRPAMQTAPQRPPRSGQCRGPPGD